MSLNKLTVGLLLVGLCIGLIFTGLRNQQLKHDAWLKDHHLFTCDGAYIRINGGDADAHDFAVSHCKDWNLAIANQDYGL